MEATDSVLCIICARASKKGSSSGLVMLMLPSLIRDFRTGKMIQSNLASMTPANTTRKLF